MVTSLVSKSVGWTFWKSPHPRGSAGVSVWSEIAANVLGMLVQVVPANPMSVAA